jgi:subtilisin family serine protease
MMRLGFKRSCAVLAVVFVVLCGAGLAQEKKDTQDPLFEKQKLMFEKLGVLKAWEMTRGSEKVLVGVVDQGFDFFHPDLKSRLKPGFYAPGAYHTEIFENIAHGTMVASIICARTDNSTGMKGLAPDCPVLTASIGLQEHFLLKFQKEFFRDNPGASLADFQKEMVKRQADLKAFTDKWIKHIATATAGSVRYLVDSGAKVINLSLYLGRENIQDKELRDMLDSAFAYAKEKDVILLVGAGNNAIHSEDYPGDESFTVVVGASLLNDKRWEEEKDIRGGKIKQGSNYGKRLTLMAPVENIVVCMPHDERFYETKDGPFGASKVAFDDNCKVYPMGATSCATPVVTSLVALVRSLRPDLKAPEVIEILKKGCDDIGEKGFDEYTGHGRVNFAKTLELAKNWKK